MKCPSCGSLEDRVIDSRTGGDGTSIRRRRVCQDCERRFTTYERIEAHRPLVIKKDESREPFNRDKILSGLRKACKKRPVDEDQLEEVVERLEQILQERGDPEIDARIIGAILIDELKGLDSVAYARFASVYEEFADISEFGLLAQGEPGDETSVRGESLPKPDAGKRDAGKPDAGKLGAGKLGAGKPNAGKRDRGKSSSGEL